MPWSRKLATPIVLKDGRMIATLGEAREMMLSVPRCIGASYLAVCSQAVGRSGGRQRLGCRMQRRN